ncbi:Flp pilus assembly complex ATPase component TadA [Candidatus Woesearchaeota archaeon]|nr:Flp pilus assembly complex ATPase component TadA [Candidatus Woesearchaeota archaeon]
MEEKKDGCFSSDAIREGEENVLRIDCDKCSFFPSIEDNSLVMSKTIDLLIENPGISRIVLYQKRDYEYDYEQTRILAEIAALQAKLAKSSFTTYRAFGLNAKADKRYAELQNLIRNTLKADPLAAYVELTRMHRRETLRLEAMPKEDEEQQKRYINLLESLGKALASTRLITLAKPHLAGYKPGDRSAYRELFSPMTKPDFMFTKLMAAFPPESEEIDSYTVKDTDIAIFKVPDSIKMLYHMTPPEFKLSEDKYELLDAARAIVSEHKPQRTEFVDPERLRQVFSNIGSDLIEELAGFRGIKLRNSEVKELTRILVRHTIGFGMVEVLLQDEKVQDITINSPMGNIPIFIVHQDYDDCLTNLIPTPNEGESWASKLRLLSGRPLDEANPILDTELSIPYARARVAVISPPLNPTGLAYAFRRHRDKPWTLALFIKNRMMSPLSAGLLSFLIDGARTMLVAGTRSAGKTSLLGAVMTEIMRKYRLITIEDSVAGDSSIIIRRNGKTEHTTIGALVDNLISSYGKWYSLTEHEVTGNPENIEVFSINDEGKVVLSRVTKFIRHKTNKEMFLVRTRTGREIKVTGDHSLFCIGEKKLIEPVKTTELKPGDFLVTPRALPMANPLKRHINLLDHLERLENTYFFGEPISDLINRNRAIIKRICKGLGIKKGKVDFWLRKGLLPCKILIEIKLLGYELQNHERIFFKHKNSRALPVLIPLTPDFLTLIGMWLGDGCYDRTSVIISSGEDEAKTVIKKVADSLGLKVRMHSDGFSSMINSSVLKLVYREVLELVGDSYTKSMPKWAYSLDKQQAGCILRGMFSADGCVADKEIVIPIASLRLLKDIQSLLLSYGIILRIGKIRKDKTYNASISSLEMWRKMKHIGFLQRKKAEKLKRLCNKKSTHATSDIIPLSLPEKQGISANYSGFNKNDYIVRGNNLGRQKLLEVSSLMPIQNKDRLRMLAESDIFFDQIAEIRPLGAVDGYVYDLSVPQFENFVCENILAHNTLELPVTALKDLGYNVQQMKVASAMTRGTTEVPADEGIRTTLRMGDSGLIVGEVRSVEAKALYEAMRVGALANVVAGTIHGDSPYGVFDRVVNDLGVPKTSFKATDIIVVANPIRSADGLHRWRRVTQITEVGKFWENDPIAEKGFKDLMKYDSQSDSLEPTTDLLNGDSDVLKAIAANVKEWAGSWDAVWDNILLRAKLKETLIRHAEETNMPELLEAGFAIQSNDEFHRISDETREELGYLDSKKIFFDWNEWLKRAIKKQSIKPA